MKYIQCARPLLLPISAAYTTAAPRGRHHRFHHLPCIDLVYRQPPRPSPSARRRRYADDCRTRLRTRWCTGGLAGLNSLRRLTTDITPPYAFRVGRTQRISSSSSVRKASVRSRPQGRNSQGLRLRNCLRSFSIPAGPFALLWQAECAADTTVARCAGFSLYRPDCSFHDDRRSGHRTNNPVPAVEFECKIVNGIRCVSKRSIEYSHRVEHLATHGEAEGLGSGTSTLRLSRLTLYQLIHAREIGSGKHLQPNVYRVWWPSGVASLTLGFKAWSSSAAELLAAPWERKRRPHR